MKALVVLLSLAVALLGCPRPAVPPIVDGDGDYPGPDGVLDDSPEGSVGAIASPCGIACMNLREIDCSDGFPRKGVTCYRGCVSMAKQQRVPTSCWAHAKSVEDARACGGIRCRP